MGKGLKTARQKHQGATKIDYVKKASLPVLPKKHLYIIAVSAIACLLLGTFLLLPSSDVEAYRKPLPLALNLQPPTDANTSHENPPIQEPMSSSPTPTPTNYDEPQTWQEIEVESGDNLAKIFKRVGQPASKLHHLVHSSKKARKLTKIYPGHKLAFQIDAQGNLIALKHIKSRLKSDLYSKTESGYEINEIIRQPEIKLAYRSAEIKSSLFLAAQQAQLSHNTIMEIANIFGWDIDFVLDIREGDTFELLFEEKFLDGEKLEDGRILAARFINAGKTYEAVIYKDLKNNTNYYTPKGLSMRKEFLRSPVDFARISSHFNLRRRHPVLHTIRAHKGTDYAARRGTPVKATGDGKVIYAARKGGYGKVVIIQHGQKYQTLYAHLNAYHRGIRSGKRVKQGQIIGYVGSTGLATGPHLHYEFRMNGSVRNPVTVKLPKAQSIPKNEKNRFFANTQNLIKQLATYKNNANQQFAKIESN